MRLWVFGLFFFAASAVGEEGGARLYYVFSGTENATDLALRAAQRHGADLVEFDRRAGDALLRVEREGGVWGEALSRRLREKGDYLLLVDGRDRLLAQAQGPTALADFVRLARPTEVDESTWGKVKDLFK